MPRKGGPSAGRYGNAALVVAAVGCAASAVLASALATDLLGFTSLSNLESIRRAILASLGLAIVGLAVFTLLRPGEVRRFLGGRHARYGSNTLVMSLAFAAVVVVTNVLGERYPFERDLTADRSNTLAPETLQVLAMLPDRVTATAFFTTGNSYGEELLRNLQSQSKGKLEYRYVNPDLDPIAARRAGIAGEGNIAFSMDDRTEIASYPSESEVVRALIRLIEPGSRVVYFLTGHGEAALSGSGSTGLTKAKETLESKNYAVKELSLLTAESVPEDALAVVIAGPQKPLRAREVSLLRAYVARGGSLVVLEDPRSFTEFGEDSDPLGTYLSASWGVVLNDDVVLSPESQNLLLAVVGPADIHPITQNLRYVTVMPAARSLSLHELDGLTQTPLLQTSSAAWGEKALDLSAEGATASFDASTDLAGPLQVAIAAEDPESRARIVAFGNSAFISDEWLDTYGNANVFANSIDWAAEQEDLLDITPRPRIERTFTPPNQLQQTAIIIGSLLGLPGLVVAAGVYAWLARRRKG